MKLRIRGLFPISSSNRLELLGRQPRLPCAFTLCLGRPEIEESLEVSDASELDDSSLATDGPIRARIVEDASGDLVLLTENKVLLDDGERQMALLKALEVAEKLEEWRSRKDETDEETAVQAFFEWEAYSSAVQEVTLPAKIGAARVLGVVRIHVPRLRVPKEPHPEGMFSLSLDGLRWMFLGRDARSEAGLPRSAEMWLFPTGDTGYAKLLRPVASGGAPEPLVSSEEQARVQSWLEEGGDRYPAIEALLRARDDADPRFRVISAAVGAELAVKDFLIRCDPDCWPKIRRGRFHLRDLYQRAGVGSDDLELLDRLAKLRNELVHEARLDAERTEAYRAESISLLEGTVAVLAKMYRREDGTAFLGDLIEEHFGVMTPAKRELIAASASWGFPPDWLLIDMHPWQRLEARVDAALKDFPRYSAQVVDSYNSDRGWTMEVYQAEEEVGTKSERIDRGPIDLEELDLRALEDIIDLLPPPFHVLRGSHDELLLEGRIEQIARRVRRLALGIGLA